MSAPGTAPHDPSSFELRGRPRPVRRIRRGLVFAVITLSVCGIAALFVLGLKSPSFLPKEASELLNTDSKPLAPGLETLPKRYDAVPLAPPLPEPPPKAIQAPGLPPSLLAATTEDQENERLGRQARSASVFFQIKGGPALGGLKEAGQTEAGAFVMPGEIAPSALSALPASPPLPKAPEGAPASSEAQAQKLAFLNGKADKDTYNPHHLVQPASPYQVMASTVIAASLLTGLNSDLPGFAIAQVTEPVYDTVTGRFLLIPQGSRLIGRYDARVSFGQDRALLVWQRIIRPDGSSLTIDNLPGADAGGYAGVADEVDFHTWRLLKGIALATLLNVGTALSANDSDSDLVKALRESTGQTANRAGQAIVERELAVQPTITVRPGFPLRVIVHKDLVLEPYASAQAR